MRSTSATIVPAHILSTSEREITFYELITTSGEQTNPTTLPVDSTAIVVPRTPEHGTSSFSGTRKDRSVESKERKNVAPPLLDLEESFSNLVSVGETTVGPCRSTSNIVPNQESTTSMGTSSIQDTIQYFESSISSMGGDRAAGIGGHAGHPA